MKCLKDALQSKSKHLLLGLLAIILVILIMSGLVSCEDEPLDELWVTDGHFENIYSSRLSTDYTTIISRLVEIKSSAEAAVVNANAAVVAAQAAVIAAEEAAAKVELFNSAEVYLFPETTNVTITLTAGNTNVWSDWVEVADSTNVTLSSKFAAAAGYINDMYIYDHSAVDKLYCIELSYGASKTTLGRMMWHTAFKDTVQIKSRRVPAGETIYYRMMCSGANGATAKIGFRYFYE